MALAPEHSVVFHSQKGSHNEKPAPESCARFISTGDFTIRYPAPIVENNPNIYVAQIILGFSPILTSNFRHPIVWSGGSGVVTAGVGFLVGVQWKAAGERGEVKSPGILRF
jgi:hypothetical protein